MFPQRKPLSFNLVICVAHDSNTWKPSMNDPFLSTSNLTKRKIKTGSILSVTSQAPDGQALVGTFTIKFAMNLTLSSKFRLLILRPLRS